MHDLRPKPRGIRQDIVPGRSPEMAPHLPSLDSGDRIHGVLKPAETDHFFKVRLDSETRLRLALATTNSVAGLQMVRSPEGRGDGRINPADVLAASSTLVTNPTTLDLTPGAGSYLIRFYTFYNDREEYLLSLSAQSSRTGRSPSRAIGVQKGFRRVLRTEIRALTKILRGCKLRN